MLPAWSIWSMARNPAYGTTELTCQRAEELSVLTVHDAHIYSSHSEPSPTYMLEFCKPCPCLILFQPQSEGYIKILEAYPAHNPQCISNQSVEIEMVTALSIHVMSRGFRHLEAIIGI